MLASEWHGYDSPVPDYQGEVQGNLVRSVAYNVNAAGQMTSVTQPETGTTTFGYDASGRPAWKRDAKQQLTEFSYDAYNRTTQILRYKRVAGADVLDPGAEDGVLLRFGGQWLGPAGVDFDVSAFW